MTKRKPAEEKEKAGRPRLINSPEELEGKADIYFAECETKSKPPTMAGLVYALGFSDRKALTEYEKYPGFSDTVKRLRLRIEQDRSEKLIGKDTFTPGIIFDLKNNHNWVDKQEVEHSASAQLLGLLEARRKRARGI